MRGETKATVTMRGEGEGEGDGEGEGSGAASRVLMEGFDSQGRVECLGLGERERGLETRLSASNLKE